MGRATDFARTARTLAARVLPPLVLLALYALGVWEWGKFYRWGRVHLLDLDLDKESAYYSVLRDAITHGRIPFRMSAIHQGTDRFLGLPETNLLPHVLLLPFVDTGRFLLLNTLVLYTAGFVGCLLLRRRYGLGLGPFCLLFLLFNFNGYITSHLSAGHSMWNGYFLSPFVCLFLLEIVEGRRPSWAGLKLALVLFAMLLQGSFHLVVCWWMFLFFFAVFNPRLWRPAFLALAFSAGLGFFRLLPAGVTFWGDQREWLTGYPTLKDMLEAFVCLRGRDYLEMGTDGLLHWWEFDCYTGIIGLGLLLYFGVWYRARDGAAPGPPDFGAFDAPAAVLLFFSLGPLFKYVTLLPVPLINAERVSSRFIFVPVVVFLVLASVRMQRALEGARKSAALYVLLVGAILETYFTLDAHLGLWKVARPEDPGNNPGGPGEVVSRPDAGYVASVWAGVAVSLIAVLAWLVAWRRIRRAALTPARTA